MTKKLSQQPISRRTSLRLLGAAGATMLVGWSGREALYLWPSSNVKASALSCVVKPAQTEGPYFVDEKLNRSDIRTDPATNTLKPGIPLLLKINVSAVNNGSCTPLQGAYVDIWHCDATGSYSDVRDNSFDTRGQRYLRGYQVTDSNGGVTFQTIYPGWYSGRAVHIHFKIRLFNGNQQTYEFTSQLYFDDTLTDTVHAQTPYNAKGSRDTRNSRDGIYSNGGNQLLLNVTQNGSAYIGTFDIGLEGVVVSNPTSDAPVINNVVLNKKKLVITGQNFDTGATVFLNGQTKVKTFADPSSPTTSLIIKKAAKKFIVGETVRFQVRNSDNSFSNEYVFTMPT